MPPSGRSSGRSPTAELARDDSVRVNHRRPARRLGSGERLPLRSRSSPGRGARWTSSARIRAGSPRLEPLLVDGLRLRSPDKAAGEPAGGNTLPVGGDARHDRRVVPVGLLYDPASARRQVVANLWGVQPELAVVDDVEGVLVPGRDPPPVWEPAGIRGLAAQHADRRRQVDLTRGP